jgi:uncharacterized protein with PQ loop repeat
VLVYIYIDTLFLFYHSFIDMLRRKEKEKINHPFSNFIFMNINFFIYLSSNNQSIIRIPRTIREKKNEREYYCFMKDINERTNLLRQQKPNTHTEKKKKTSMFR